ncbi:MAG: DUF4836 family protein [Bacteroidaceae bacterium]|nr:DUF4836 family protein [Bacteroidaceae bacterium]
MAIFDFTTLLRNAQLDAKDIKTLLNLHSEDEVSHLGVDWTRPFVGFLSAGDCFGLAACVSNDAELAATCRQWEERGECGKIMSQRGYSWVVVRGKWLMAFNTKKALLMGPCEGDVKNELMGEMYSYLEQSSDESGLASPLYQAVNGDKAPMNIAANTRVIPSLGSESVRGRLGVRDANDLIMKINMNFSAEQIALRVGLKANTEKVEEALEDMGDGFDEINGSLVPLAGRGTIGWVCANLEGDEVLDFMHSIPYMRSALVMMNLAVDADMIIRAIDGDVAIGWNSSDGSAHKGIPPFCLSAELKNMDFLQHSDYWIESAQKRGGVSIFAESPSDFCMSMGGSQVWLGAKDNIMYLTNDSALRSADGNSWLANRKNEIKGKRIYMTADVPKAMKALGLENSSIAQQLSLFQSVTLKAEGIDDWELYATSGKNQNLVRELLFNTLKN